MKRLIHNRVRPAISRRFPEKLAPLIASLFVTFRGPALAQATSARSFPGGQSKTLWQQITEGGWIMLPIALCSIATLYLIGDGIIRTSRKKIAPSDQEEAMKILFRQGDYVGAHTYC